MLDSLLLFGKIFIAVFIYMCFKGRKRFKHSTMASLGVYVAMRGLKNFDMTPQMHNEINERFMQQAEWNNAMINEHNMVHNTHTDTFV